MATRPATKQKYAENTVSLRSHAQRVKRAQGDDLPNPYPLASVPWING
jgi:hypothetical protein